MIVADVVDGVVVDSGVDVRGALTSPLSDFIDMGLDFLIERANVHGVRVDFDTQLKGKCEQQILFLLLGRDGDDSA